MPREKTYAYWPTYWAMREAGFSDRTAEMLTRDLTHPHGTISERRGFALKTIKGIGRAWLGIGYLPMSQHPEKGVDSTLPFDSEGDMDLGYNPNGWQR